MISTTLLRLSHGENRGSSPLGSASYFNPGVYGSDRVLCSIKVPPTP